MTTEIDRRIAVEVMGCRHIKGWSPSTNIAHAFEVVEKMNKDGWYFNFGQVQRDGVDKWYCELDKYDTLEDENAPEEIQGKPFPHHYYELDVEADTPSMAICLASLKCLDK